MSTLELLKTFLSPEQVEAIAALLIEAMAKDGWGGIEITIRDHHLHSATLKQEKLFDHKNGVKKTELPP